MNPFFFLLAFLGMGASRMGRDDDAATVETRSFTSDLPEDTDSEPTPPATDGDIAANVMDNGDDPMHTDSGMGGMDSMDHGDDHSGHDMPALTPPEAGASDAEIASYLEGLFALGETHVHDMTSEFQGEHTAAMDLVPREASTHVAIADGDWSDPSIWASGEIPGDDAKVLIPEGVTVTYGEVSDARLFTVRVDGTLDFATYTSSQMIFDTFVVSPSGHLIIGTETDPVHANVDIDLVVANNGPIDTDWDPMLLSRGLISHGETTIHGAIKDSHEKVDTDPMSGDTSISFAEVPTGWEVGDTIVIAGTHYDGYKWNHEEQDVTLHPNEDEIRVITKIDDDGTIHFEEPLIFDHDAPRDDLSTSVANYTRNVSIETENAETAEVYERGHLMFMHSDDVDVRYLEVHEMGRTDKSEPSVEAGNQVNDFDTNVQGRYSLHLHRTGTENQDDPAIIVGTSVYGSPGWGYVHHDSNAIFENNASFDTFGAGYVAETGNETGAWIDNIAIYAEGISWGSPKNTTDISSTEFDTARGGDGFWFQGRMVASADNVAASVNTGFVYFHRDGDNRMIEFDADVFAFPDALYDGTSLNPDDAPILIFQGNETFAAKEGLHIVKANPNQGHDVWSHLDDFTAWSVKTGAHLEYTSHYILTNFDVVGKEPTQFSNPETGISIGKNASEITIIEPTISGFETGMNLQKFAVNLDNLTAEKHNFIIVDPAISNVTREYDNFDPALDTIIASDELRETEPSLNLNPLDFGNGIYSSTIITGSKVDSLGETDFPGGSDTFKLQQPDAVRILETDGYWTTSSGEAYFLLDIYFTDRLNGEIYYETHPVMVPDGTSAKFGEPWWDYENVIDNGVQDFVTKDGTLYAGDKPLDVAIQVPLPEAPTVPENIMVMSMAASMVDDTHMTMHVEMTDDLWINGHSEDETLSLDIDDGLFVNTGQMENTDLTVTGGDAVLATDSAEYDVENGRTLAIFDAAAKVGFDGEDGGMAILDMHEGGTLAYSAASGDLGTIEEFDSPAFPGAPDVESGIDLGGSTLEIDLEGLSADAGTEFTLMDVDELVGVFDDPVVGGLGARNANIVIDYLNDSVTLQLTAGHGAVTVETIGEQTDVTDGSEALWKALTADQGLAEDQPLPEEEDILEVA